MRRIAIIGSGVAGLACATRLAADPSLEITIFDKGRHPGGRLASRDRDQNQFDYGAQYFTARSTEFKSVIYKMMEAGAVEIWKGRFAKQTGAALTDDTSQGVRYVGSPCMRSMAEALIKDTVKGFELRQHHRVTRIERADGFWNLFGELTRGEKTGSFEEKEFDWLTMTLPPVQAAQLWQDQEQTLERSNLSPCIAAMLTFDSPLPVEYDGIRIDDTVLAWAARDSSKPGRPPGERWVLHANPQWSQDNLSLNEEETLNALRTRFFQLLNIDEAPPSFSRYHRWRYALVSQPAAELFFINPESNLAYCGDWCAGARVEAAFLSGSQLGKKLLETF